VNFVRAAFGLLALVTVACLPGVAGAQAYPAKPVRVIVPFPPGQGTDVATRYLMDKLTRALGRTFFVENKPGAGASLGVEVLAHAPPDGYTLGIATSGSQTMNPSLYPSVGYDPDQDFAPITLTGMLPLMIAANPAFPASSISELVAQAKARPDAINVAVPAPPQRIVLELLRQQAGAPLFAVPYKGSATALSDVLGGQVPVIVDSITALRPHVDAHKLKALAVSSAKSSELMPGVPSIAEQGFPGVELTAWNGLFAPKGTPAAIVSLLNSEMRKILADPQTRAHLLSLGFEATGSTPEELAERVRSDRAKWSRIIREAHIEVS
jgi:tripartite-type tricarboxylate transporter receptor subunit TctC